MKLLLTVTLLLLSTLSFAEEPVKCDQEPITKNYAGSDWFVYSCADDKTVIIYSAPDSPASPFYFMFYLKDGKYQLYGEGTGNKLLTKAASDYLSTLKPGEIAELISQTKKINIIATP